MDFTWSIDNVRRNTADGGVITIYWRCTANGVTDKRGLELYKASSLTVVPDPSSADFVPYGDLTESIVLSWVRDEIGSDVEEEMTEAFSAYVEENTSTGVPW